MFLMAVMVRKFFHQTPDSKMFFRLEKFSGHESKNFFPLSSVKIFFLPANTKPRLQPIDARIIESFNHIYRNMKNSSALDIF